VRKARPDVESAWTDNFWSQLTLERIDFLRCPAVGQYLLFFLPLARRTGAIASSEPVAGNGYSDTFDHAFCVGRLCRTFHPEIDGVPSESVVSALERGT
jgi:hypothetical protein